MDVGKSEKVTSGTQQLLQLSGRFAVTDTAGWGNLKDFYRLGHVIAI